MSSPLTPEPASSDQSSATPTFLQHSPPRSPESQKAGLFSYENKLTILFMFTIGLVCFDRLAINFLIPYIQEDLDLNNTQVGMLAAAAALTWSVTAIVGGRLSDKVKSKRNYLVALITAFSLASMLQGFAGSFVHLVILRLLMGVFEGPVAPVSQSVLAIESSPHRRGFNLGMAMSTGQGLFGAILAPIVVVALAEQFDWRNAFFFTLLPGLILAGFVWKIMREPEPRDTDGQAFATERHESHSRSEIGTILRNRNVMLGVTMFTGFMVFAMVFQVYSPLYLTSVHGLSPTVMSFIMAAFGVGAALWGFTVPLISDYIGRKPTAFFFALISAFGPLAIIFLDGPIILGISMFIFSAGMAVGGMSATVIPAEAVPPSMAGLAVGIPIGLGELIGGFGGPLIAGIAGDAFGLQAALLVASCGALLCSFAALFLRETAPRIIAKQNPEVAVAVSEPMESEQVPVK